MCASVRRSSVPGSVRSLRCTSSSTYYVAPPAATHAPRRRSPGRGGACPARSRAIRHGKRPCTRGQSRDLLMPRKAGSGRVAAVCLCCVRLHLSTLSRPSPMVLTCRFCSRKPRAVHSGSASLANAICRPPFSRCGRRLTYGSWHSGGDLRRGCTCTVPGRLTADVRAQLIILRPNPPRTTPQTPPWIDQSRVMSSSQQRQPVPGVFVSGSTCCRGRGFDRCHGCRQHW